FGAEQRDGRAKPSSRQAEGNPGNDVRLAPARPAVVRREGNDQEVKACESIDRDDHSTAGLDKRLTADAVRIVSGRQPRSPAQSTVAGRAHLDQIAER